MPDDAKAAAPLRVSIVLIGDELLDGYVADRNAHWLAGRLAALGIPLDRISTVPDEHAAIAEALSAELARARPRLVVTSGGIGSTPDDVTMAAVARFLRQPLVPHPEISARIDALVQHSASTGNPIDDEQADVIRRMARAPAGSRVLAGSTGMIPGVVVDVDGGVTDGRGASIAVLPGVPDQFREIVEHAVEPEMLAGRGVRRETAEFIHDHPESAFTPVLDRLNRSFPDLTVGSYPAARCTIRLKGSKNDVSRALDELRTHAARLERDPVAKRRREAWRTRSG